MSSLGDGIDLFLIGERYSPKRNETHLRVISSLYLNDTWGLKPGFGFAFNLHLPNFQEYWNLKFTSYDQSRDRGVKKTIPGEELPERFGAGLLFLRTLGKFKFNYEPRLELAKRFGISHHLSLETIEQLGWGLALNPKTELFAKFDRGPGLYQALNLTKPLSENHQIALINQAEFFDRGNLLLVTQGLSHTHSLPQLKATLNYLFLLEHSNSQGYHLDRYLYTVVYSQVIYDRALEYTIAPALSFPSQRGFAGSASIGASLIFIF
jgi:hypothetical protein